MNNKTIYMQLRIYVYLQKKRTNNKIQVDKLFYVNCFREEF